MRIGSAGERDMLVAARRQVVRLKAGEEATRTSKSPCGTRTKAIMANRVKSSSGSFNASWRQESGCGDTDQPDADNIRVSAKNAEHEKLNDERGIKPLPVSGSRDGAESGND